MKACKPKECPTCIELRATSAKSVIAPYFSSAKRGKLNSNTHLLGYSNLSPLGHFKSETYEIAETMLSHSKA